MQALLVIALTLGGAGSAHGQNIDTTAQHGLIDELERTNQLVRRAHETGVAVATLVNPESVAALARQVAELKDPGSIPVLARAMGTFTLIPYLTDYGELAAPAVLDVVTDPATPTYTVYDGLVVLRMMIENEGDRPLSAETKVQIHGAAHQRLTDRQHFGYLLRAVELAGVLDDPFLDEMLLHIARDPSETGKWGLEPSGLADLVRQAALDGLSGVPPRPRYEGLPR